MVIEATKTSDLEASIELRGFSPARLRWKAATECDRALGKGSWHFTRAEVVPCMVSTGGHVRLYAGRFSATRG
ncbi:MAG TPA: hypothetical protein VEH52_05985 [Gaiellaceae bacterium]|jgi:hypothetical protein|nr:hypothetical protein [Gaiellaceae bacterium]